MNNGDKRDKGFLSSTSQIGISLFKGGHIKTLIVSTFPVLIPLFYLVATSTRTLFPDLKISTSHSTLFLPTLQHTMNRLAIAESLIGGLVTVMTPVSVAYIFCLWSGRTIPKIDHRAVASTWSFCSKLREAKIFIPITSLRSKSSKHTVPTASILPETITVRPTASFKAKPFWSNPFYKAPKLPPGQVCALVVIMIICFSRLVWFFIVWTRQSTISGQLDRQSGEKPLFHSTHSERPNSIGRHEEDEATGAKSSSIDYHLKQMRGSADKMKENCATLDETHKQIETKFDSLSSSIEFLNERQEKKSIPKEQKKESAADKQKGYSSGFEKVDQQLGRLIRKFDTQGQQMQFHFRFSDTGSLGYDSMPGSFSTPNNRTRSECPESIFQAGKGTEQNDK